MSKSFGEQFDNLINPVVQRTFIQDKDTVGSDIPIEYPTLETNELPKPPTDGFIANYCNGKK